MWQAPTLNLTHAKTPPPTQKNSGDTGGIVHNMWQDFHWEKINFHIQHLGLRPWFLRE